MRMKKSFETTEVRVQNDVSLSGVVEDFPWQERHVDFLCICRGMDIRNGR